MAALTSKKLAGVSHAAERLYWRVYLASDNYGTMSGEPWDVWLKATPSTKGYTEASVGQALADLIEAGLIEAWVEAGGSHWIHVVGHDRHQYSEFLRKRGKRRSPVPPSQRENVAPMRDSAVLRSKSGPTLPTEQEQEHPFGIVREGSTNVDLSDSQNESHGATLPELHLTNAKRTLRGQQIREVFNHWKVTTDRTDRTKLDTKRRSRISARLAEGFSPDDLKQAIWGFSQDPWYRGDNSNGKEYLGIETVLRDAAQVEKGIDLAKQHDKTSPSREQENLIEKARRAAAVAAQSREGVAS